MADHLIDIVNEKDEVIGSAMKSKKPELGFISRVSAVFVKDYNGKIIICKRGPNKKTSPNKFDLSACGNVDAGENYDQAAQRELWEETGIKCQPKMLDKFYQEVDESGKKFKYFVGIFVANSNNNPKLNEEIVSFRRLSINEIEEEISKIPENFCQGFIRDFNQVKEKLKILEKL